MTRKSKREIETALDELGESEEFTVQDFLWADLKNAHGGRLSEGERALLEDPEAHLPTSALRRVDIRGGSQ